MNPINSSQGGDALEPQNNAAPQSAMQNGSQGSPQTLQPQDQQSVTANVIRGQIDAIYGDRPVASREGVTLRESQPASHIAPESQQSLENPYHQTHIANPRPEAEQWKAYHSAWQDYYQKYYDAYYQHKHAQEQASQQTDTQQQTQPSEEARAQAGEGYFSDQIHTTSVETQEDISKDAALLELRQKLLGKVKDQATKIRRSKHFVPIAAALGVVLIFVFLQYNRVFIATVNAYVSPGSVDPQNIVIDPSASNEVSQDPRLIIPKINVDVPAIYGIGADHDSQMKAMENGVAHFGIPGANSRPGEIGNTVLSGHSSNDLFDAGDYKFIFAQLEKLSVGDTIYANYEGKRYTYVITKTEVVKPTEVQKLIYPTDKPVLTLITCTPLGTALNRLLVTAEQISPDPASAASAPEGSGSVGQNEPAIPGNSATFLERLFGSN